MSEHIDQTIADLQRHIADLTEQANDAKKTINSLCKMLGRSAMYDDLDTPAVIINSPKRGDEYHGRPFATVVREILEQRRAANLGPASLDELYDTMIEGGYIFTGKDNDVKKRGLSIAVAKNMTFYKLPNGRIGIREWYPSVKEQKQTVGKQNQQDETSGQETTIGELPPPVIVKEESHSDIENVLVAPSKKPR
jgi:hypothetical protein